MALILCIESSAEVCSVALSCDGKGIVVHEGGEERDHAKVLAPLIQKVLDEGNCRVAEIDAVAVSRGPGSYTSLRIGVSTAKGLCFAANKPLISIGSLHSLAALARVEEPSFDGLLCPLMDARRMEVYTALYDMNLNVVEDVSAKEVIESTFEDLLNGHRTLFFGSGLEKCRPMLQNINASFAEVKPSAEGMVALAEQAFLNEDFEDVAYFEPFYLKDFVAIKAKNKFF